MLLRINLGYVNILKKKLKMYIIKNKESLTNNLLSYKQVYGNYITSKKAYYDMSHILDFNTISLK